MARLSSGSSTASRASERGGVKTVRKTVYRTRRMADSGLFTDSALVYFAKTSWARLTTPRAIATYRDICDRIIDQAALVLEALGVLILVLCRYLWLLPQGLWSLGARVRRGSRRGVDGARRSVARSAAKARALGLGMSFGLRTALRGILGILGILGSWLHRGGSLPRWSARCVWLAASWVLRAASWPWRVAARLRGAGFGLHGTARWLADAVPRPWGARSGLSRAGSGLRRAGARLAVASCWAIRRCRPAPVPIILTCVLLLGLPIGSDIVSAVSLDVRSKISLLSRPSIPEITLPRLSVPRVSIRTPDLPGISIPRISLPKMSMPELSVPAVSFRVPAFVAAPVARLDEMITGPLLEPGARVLVADLAIEGRAADDLGGVLALAVEAELSRSRYFSVVPRERALAETDGAERADFVLTEAQALALVPVSGSAAVVAGTLTPLGEAFAVRLAVLDAAGGAVYEATTQASEEELPAALAAVVARLRRRLGESSEPVGVGASQRPEPVLSRSLSALRAYYRARAHLDQRRVGPAIAAAAEAVRDDPAFASGYRVQAEAYAMAGQRRRARESLEKAWRYRNRLSERERLRLAADKTALAGRYPAAILAYDQLFNLYRDDVTALKSQAILQEMIGVRGGGMGNLRVAYSIDPVDWPPLRRIARFLGYRGRLPSVESFAAETQT